MRCTVPAMVTERYVIKLFLNELDTKILTIQLMDFICQAFSFKQSV